MTSCAICGVLKDSARYTLCAREIKRRRSLGVKLPTVLFNPKHVWTSDQFYAVGATA